MTIHDMWWPLAGRLRGIWCWLQWHDLGWNVDADWLCPGDIVCNTCDTVVWCRAHDPWRKHIL